MATKAGKTLIAKTSPGALQRGLLEQKTKTAALPVGKGEYGTLGRRLYEEPLERQVAPGSEKILSIKPAVSAPDVGILPPSPVGGQVAPAVGVFGGRQIGGGPLAVKDRPASTAQSDLDIIQSFEKQYVGTPISDIPSGEGASYNEALLRENPPQRTPLQIERTAFVDKATATPLEQRLGDMWAAGKRQDNSQKFAKLWRAYKKGGTTKAGYSSAQAEAQAAQETAEKQKFYESGYGPQYSYDDFVRGDVPVRSQAGQGQTEAPVQDIRKTGLSTADALAGTEEGVKYQINPPPPAPEGEVLGASSGMSEEDQVRAGILRSNLASAKKDLDDARKEYYAAGSSQSAEIKLSQDPNYGDAADVGVAGGLLRSAEQRMNEARNKINSIEAELRSLGQKTGGF